VERFLPHSQDGLYSDLVLGEFYQITP